MVSILPRLASPDALLGLGDGMRSLDSSLPGTLNVLPCRTDTVALLRVRPPLGGPGDFDRGAPGDFDLGASNRAAEGDGERAL